MKSPQTVSPGLFLVGTCHRDPRGLRRCRALLDFLRPDVVLVEVSPFAVWIRQEHRRFFRRLLHENLAAAAAAHGMSLSAALRTAPVQQILVQCALPFELRAARLWYAASKTPYFCVDRSEASRLFVSDWPHLLSSKNLTGLLRSDAPKPPAAAEEYRRARAALSGLRPVEFLFADDSLWASRERWLEKGIRTTLRAFGSARLVYLGGWTHVVPNDGLSLFDRVRDLAPVSLLLEEADRFESPAETPAKPTERAGSV